MTRPQLSRVGRIALGGIGSELLTTMLWAAAVVALMISTGEAAQGLVRNSGAYFSILGGLLCSALGGYWATRTSRGDTLDGALVGLTAALINVLLTASSGKLGALASLVLVRCIGRIVGGVLGGWLAARANSKVA